jgi:hypothetical protein
MWGSTHAYFAVVEKLTGSVKTTKLGFDSVHGFLLTLSYIRKRKKENPAFATRRIII